MKNLILFTVIGLLSLTGCSTWDGEITNSLEQRTNYYPENFYRKNLDQTFDENYQVDAHDIYVPFHRNPFWFFDSDSRKYYKKN